METVYTRKKELQVHQKIFKTTDEITFVRLCELRLTINTFSSILAVFAESKTLISRPNLKYVFH